MKVTVYNPLTERCETFTQAYVTGFTDIEKYEYKKHLTQTGSFTLIVPADTDGADLVAPDMLLYVDEGGSGTVNDCLIVTAVESDSHYITITGKDMKHLLSYRVTMFPQEEIDAGTYGYDVRKGQTSGIIEGYVTYNCISPQDSRRKITGLEIKAGSCGIVNDSCMSRLEPLDQLVRKLCENAAIWYDISFSPGDMNSKYVMELSHGYREVTTLSENMYTVSKVSKKTDISPRRTCIWAVNGNDVDDAVVTSFYKSRDEGFYLREAVISANCDADLTEMYVDRESAEMVETETITATLADYTMYGGSFKVGDCVNIVHQGTTYSKIASSAFKSYSAGQMTVSVEFGDIPEQKVMKKTADDLLQNSGNIKDLELELNGVKKALNVTTFYSAADPTEDENNSVKVKDRWVKFTDDLSKNLEAVYEYVMIEPEEPVEDSQGNNNSNAEEEEEEPQYEWNLLYSIEGSVQTFYSATDPTEDETITVNVGDRWVKYADDTSKVLQDVYEYSVAEPEEDENAETEESGESEEPDEPPEIEYEWRLLYSAGESSSTFYSVTDPIEDETITVNVGDRWVKYADDTSKVLQAVYEYSAVEPEEGEGALTEESGESEEPDEPPEIEYEWRLLYSAGESFSTFYSATDPTEDETITVNVGDRWVKYADDTSKVLQAVYEYSVAEPEEDEDALTEESGESEEQDEPPETEYEWRLLYSSDGGVGEWLDEGHTAERFNDYRDFNLETQTGGNYTNVKYDHIEGYGNQSRYHESLSNTPRGANHVEGNSNSLISNNWAPASHVEGQKNLCDRCFSTHVEGQSNTVRQSFYSHAEGFGNTVQNGSPVHVEGIGNSAQNSNYLHIEGNRNTVTGGQNNFVGGYDNTVSGSGCSALMLFGQGNNVTVKNSAHASAIFGESNTITYISHGIVSGCSNEVSAHNCAVFGDGNYCSASNSLVFGQGANAVGNHILVGGRGSNVITLDSFGNLWIAGSSSTSGADYAEFFEWADGNPDGEDRCGMLVDLDGDKIVPAHGDDIFGIVSALPSVVGNSYEDHWQGKFKHDVFGRIIRGDNGEAVLSENYDSTADYIPRSRRKEWAAVGMTGRLVIVDDGSCKVGGFVSARHGIGAASLKNTGVRVLKRIDQTHVEVVIK